MFWKTVHTDILFICILVKAHQLSLIDPLVVKQTNKQENHTDFQVHVN